MSARTKDTHRSNTQVGQRVELGRYTIPAGERTINGQRVDGHVRVTDVPATGRSREYLIETGLEQDGNAALRALVSDYIDQANLHGSIPMHVPMERYLDHAAA
jgi:hypothetical protein